MSVRSPLSYIPGYTKNAVIQLIVASGVGYISIQLLRICILMFTNRYDAFYNSVIPNIGLPALTLYKDKIWTLLTYGWVHTGFWELFSNMIWLYCFGNMVQMLVGYKQIIPLFFYSLIMGGLFFLVVQLAPGAALPAGVSLLGCQAGLMGFMAAALTLAPGYRFYLGPSFSIPIWVVAAVFTLLTVMNTHFSLPYIMLLAGGAACGFTYIRLLKSGHKPGEWVYDLIERMERSVTPGQKAWQKRAKKREDVLRTLGHHTHSDVSQQRIDTILDKINQKGYNSLTKEEKDILMRAGKENR